LITGGMGTSVPLADARIYDPAANMWTTAAPMSSPRIYHTSTLLPDGKVLVVGGTGGAGLPQPVDSAEIYDPVSNTWSPAATLPGARSGHTATLLSNGKVLVAGGWMDSSGAPASNGFIYDQVADAWVATGSFVDARSGHTATLLSDGRVLICGGINQSNAIVASSALYDPSTNTWATAGTLVIPRAYHTATLLPGGKLLLAGGL